MNDRSVVEAIKAMEKIRSIAEMASGDVAAPVLEALGLLANAVDRITAHASEVERNLSSQQAILDDRLLRLERSRFLTAWRHLATRYQAVIQWVSGCRREAGWTNNRKTRGARSIENGLPTRKLTIQTSKKHSELHRVGRGGR